MGFKRMLDKEIVPIDDIIKKHMIREAIQKNSNTIITPVGAEPSFYSCFTADKMFDHSYRLMFYYNVGHHTFTIARVLTTEQKEVDKLCISSLRRC